MLKRIVSFILILGICQGVVAFAAEDEQVQVAATEAELNAAALLAAFEIIVPQSAAVANPDKTVTRAEMATLAIRTMGLAKASDSEQQIVTTTEEVDLFAEAERKLQGGTTEEEVVEEKLFTDMSTNHWAYEDVSKATGLGIFSGYPDGSFAPDAPMLFEEGVKVLVSLAGYDILAKKYGGYPTGYLKVANDKKILKGVSESVDGMLTTGDCYIMLYNLLHTDALTVRGIGKGVHYESDESRTFMKEYLDISEHFGIVEAVPGATVATGVTAKEGFAFIGGERYEVGSTNVKEFLGKAVTFYARETENGPHKLVYIKEDKDCTSLVITADKLGSVKGTQSADNAEVEYVEGEKNKTLKISKNANYLYNNKLQAAMSDERLMIDNGSLVFIDNDEDEIFDLVLVYDYMSYVVDSISVRDNVVTVIDKLGKKTVTLSTHNAKVLRDGVEIEFQEVLQGEVLEVPRHMSGDEEASFEFIVATGIVTGALKEISDDSVVIDEKTYLISPFADMSNFRIGSGGDFHLDILGRVVSLQNVVDIGYEYGYMIQSAVETGIDDRVFFKMADKKGTFKAFELDKNVRVNGAKKTTDELENIFATRQLIQYKTNDDGKISDIKTAQFNDDKKFDLDNFSRDYISNGVAYNNHLHRYGESYTAVQGTTVFIIPSSDAVIDAKYYAKGAISMITTNVTSYPNVQVYDADENYEIGALVVESQVGGGGVEIENSSVNMVKSVTSILTDDGGVGIKLLYMNHLGNESEAIIEDPEFEMDTSWGYTDLKVTDLKPGDIFTATTDSFGAITGIAVYLTADRATSNDDSKYMCMSTQNKAGSTNEVLVHSSVYVTFQKVLEKSGDTIVVAGQGKDGVQKTVTFNFNARRVFIYDSERKKFTEGHINDVAVGDEVFVKAGYQNPLVMIVYR